MKWIVTAVVVVLGACAVGAEQQSAAAVRDTALLRLPRATSAGQQTLYGFVRGLTRHGGRWELNFDPALLLSGLPAEEVALQTTGSRDVPNDSLVVNETKRAYTYAVRPTATVTILTRGLQTTKVSVAELAQLLAGKNPRHRQLFGALAGFGFWIRVDPRYPSPVLSIDEQYHP